MSAKGALSMRIFPAIAALAALTTLSGCISFGAEPPERLLTLTPAANIPAGTAATGEVTAALSVEVPSVSQRLNVPRVPVTTSDSSLAYLADAVWVEKPANLFRNVLAQTIRASSDRLVLDGGELAYAASTQLSGQLVEFGYDATTSSAIVRYDAVLAMPDGRIMTRRFAREMADVLPEAIPVGAALNDAANAVAVEVAQWVGEVSAS